MKLLKRNKVKKVKGATQMKLFLKHAMAFEAASVGATLPFPTEEMLLAQKMLTRETVHPALVKLHAWNQSVTEPTPQNTQLDKRLGLLIAAM